MGYYNDISIDTRTCGQADDDDYLDRRDGLRPMTRARVFEQLDTDRRNAQDAARPLVSPADEARELAWRMMDAIKSDDKAEARRLALALKPLVGFLPE
jgi:hypothetical protein